MELDLTVSLNLKCEERLDTGSSIMEQSNAKLDIRKLPKGLELSSLSIHVTFIKITIHIMIICAKISLKRC